MDKPVLIIDAPDLNDEAVASMQAFLLEILLAFRSHYHHRLDEYHHPKSNLFIPRPKYNNEMTDQD